MKRHVLKSVKHRLIDCDMTVTQLADIFGVSVNFVSSIINGSYIPNEEHKQKISAALGCSVQELFSTIE